MVALPVKRVEDRGKIGDFEIVRELSRSSVTSVFEGYQASLDRTVLIKRLHPQLADDDDLRARFEREAKALARIKHKNIVHIYDYQASPESVHLVTEFVSGGSLADRLKQLGTLTEREAVAVAVDVLEGLKVAHREGIVHRDIKPGNLMVGHTGQIKITDFGLAQFEGSPSLTMQGMVIGTPAYIAPEVISGSPAGPRSDLFSLGVTLYELMTGVNPYLADNMSETLNRIISLKPQPLDGINPEMQRLLFKLLEKKPDRRFTSAEEALKEIAPLAEKYQVERGWVDVEPEGSKVRTTGAKDSESLIQPRPRRQLSRTWVILSAIVMVTASILVYLLIQHATTPDEIIINETPVDSMLTEVTTPDTSQAVQPDSQESRPQQDDTAPATRPVERPIEEPVQNPARQPDKTAAQGSETDSRRETGNDAVVDAPEVAIPPVTGTAYLSLHVTPWANVYDADGNFIVQTPTDNIIPVDAGEVLLTFSNPDLPPLTRTFTVEPDDTLRQTIDLMKMVGEISFINATPWARVFLDGEPLETTPIYKRLLLPFGKHILRFEHPDFPVHEEEVVLQPGDTPRSIVVDLTSQ